MLARHMSTFNNLTLTTACASSSPTYCFVFYTPISLLPVLCIGHLITLFPKPIYSLFSNLSVTYNGLLSELCIHLGHLIMPPPSYPPLPYPIPGDLPWTSSWVRLLSWPLNHAPPALSLVTYHRPPPELGIHLVHLILTTPPPTLPLVTYHGLPPELGVHLGHSILVHLVEFGVHLVLTVDDVLLQQVLRDRLHGGGGVQGVLYRTDRQS